MGKGGTAAKEKWDIPIEISQSEGRHKGSRKIGKEISQIIML